MKPLSPGAQRSLQAYRHAHSVPPAVRARLLSGLERALPEGQASLAARPLSGRRLRLLRWGGSLAVLIAGIGLSLRPEARPMTDAAPAGQVAAVVPLAALPPAAALAGPAPASPPARLVQPKPSRDERGTPRGAARRAPRRSAPQIERASSAPGAAALTVVSEPASARPPADARIAPEPSPLGARADTRASTAVQPSAAQAETMQESGTFARAPQRATEAPRAALSLDDEVLLMRRVSDHLTHGDPVRALSALAEHARLFPDGKLVAMRKAARVRALCELGKRPDAEREARAFLAQHGDSPYAAQVRRGCPR